MKLFLSIMCLCTYGSMYAQIDYDVIAKNIEDITSETSFQNYFKTIPHRINRQNAFEINDERLIKFHGAHLKKVIADKDIEGKIVLELTPFEEEQDFYTITNQLTELHGKPSIEKSYDRDTEYWIWDIEEKTISLKKEELQDEQEDPNGGHRIYHIINSITIKYKQ